MTTPVSLRASGEAAGRAHEAWPDIAKGIGILLVVYGHVARGIEKAGLPIDPVFFKTVDVLIYAFHMPLFFFVSGYLRIPLMADSDSIPIADSVPGDGGHVARVS